MLFKGYTFDLILTQCSSRTCFVPCCYAVDVCVIVLWRALVPVLYNCVLSKIVSEANTGLRRPFSKICVFEGP